MRTAAYNVGVASDRRRRKNVPRHILCSVIKKLCSMEDELMRIDNNSSMTDMRNTATTTNKSAENNNNAKDSAVKTTSSGNGLTINGSQLNLGEDLVEEKRKKARSMAMELMLDAYNHDKEIDDTIAESSAHAKSLLAENQESRSMIKDIRKEKENTNEIYGVSEGSEAAEDLEILRKGRDSMGNPQAVLTEDEYARYKELYANGLSDYHSRMLQLDADEKVYVDKIRDNKIAAARDYAFNRNMGIERLKTHEMYDAKKQGEQIIDAASKEIISNVVQDAVDNIDEDMDNKKEEALEKKQEKQEMEKRIEKAKGEAHKDDGDDELMYELNDMLDEVSKIGADSASQVPEKSMGLMVAQLQLTAQDVKGLVVDTQL